MAEAEPRLAELAEALLGDLPDLGGELDRAVFSAAPALASDPTLAAETSASSQANLRRWLTAIAAHPGREVGDPPPEALDVALSVVRRGMDISHLLTAYRAGQNLAWTRWMELAAERIEDRGELIAVLERSSALMNAYVDRVIDQVLAHVQREREAMLGGELGRRAETIRLLLDGAPIATTVASSRLGYELDRQHTALVLWSERGEPEPGELERAASALSQAAGGGRPLTLLAGGSTLWAWLGGREAGPPDLEAMRAAIAAVDPALRAAVGPTRRGMAGFRRSHEDAISVQRMLAGREGEEVVEEEARLVDWDSVRVVALAGRDPEAAREFAASVLGGLGEDGDDVARLRETARVYLEEGSSAPAAARRLHLHRNTVLYRVRRAEELLGHPLAERRLAVMLALELARRLR